MADVLLRGHHLLCLPRFRGLGYSKEFTANMRQIAKRISDEPRQIVQLLDEPDDICRFCPHLEVTGECALEDHLPVRERDEIVLRKLDVRPGEQVSYQELACRLAASADSSFIEKACAGCRWQYICTALSAR